MKRGEEMNVRTNFKKVDANRKIRGIQVSLQILMVIIVGMLALLICPGYTFAASSGTCGAGLTWTLSDKGELVISGNGNLSDGSWDKMSVRQVSIPAGVTSIEEGLFIGCDNLTSINVSSSNNQYASVNGVLLSKDTTVLIEFPPGKSGKYTIPGTVKTISIGSFASCMKVTSVTMPDSVTTLGSFAFNCCEGLTNVVISKNVKVIPSECFSNCSALTQVTIPEGVQKIKEFAFWGCRNLTKVTLPKSIDKSGISDDAFENCSLDKDSQDAVNEKVKAALTAEWELKVGESQDYELSPILKGALVETAFYAEASNQSVVDIVSLTRTGNFVTTNDVTYYFTLGIKAIGPGKTIVTVYTDKTKKKVVSKITFTITGKTQETAESLKTVISGNGIYKLSGSTAVLSKPRNKTITKLSIPATVSANGKMYKVLSVSANACKGLKKLKTVTIGKNIKKIGKNAFRDCKKLKSITIKTSNLTSSKVGANAFKGIYSKATIKVPKKKLSAYKKLLKKKGIGKKVKITK